MRSDLKRDTQLRYLYEFKKLFDFCRKQGWASDNPAEEIPSDLPRHVKRPKRGITEFFLPEDIERVLAALEYDVEKRPQRSGRMVLKDVILLAVTTGLRRGELCNLRWRDVELYELPRETTAGPTLRLANDSARWRGLN